MKVFLVIILLSISNIIFAVGKTEPYDRDEFISEGFHAVNDESTPLPKLVEYTSLEMDVIKNAAAGSAAEWKKDMLDKIKNNNLQGLFTNDNLQLLRRYAILDMEGKSQEDKKDGTYIIADDLEKELKKLHKEKSQKQNDLLKDFREKWGIEPGESLFNEYIEKYPSDIIEASKNYEAIDAAKYYGKDEIIKENIKSYKEILGIYQELKNKTELEKKSPEDDTNQYFSRNIGHFANQLKSSVSDEKGRYNSAKDDYVIKLQNIEADTNRELEECTNNVTIDSISPAGFDYYSGNEVSSIFLGINVINLSKEATDFKNRPNSKGEILNVKIMGFLEKYIYVCQDGKITLYDPFTLQRIKKEEAIFEPKGTTVLFINDTKKNILVVKNNEKCEYKAIDTKESKGRIIFTLKSQNKGVEK